MNANSFLAYSAPIKRRVLAVHPWYANLLCPTKELELFMLDKFNQASKTIDLRRFPIEFKKRGGLKEGQTVEVYATNVTNAMRKNSTLNMEITHLQSLGLGQGSQLSNGSGNIIGSVVIGRVFNYQNYPDWKVKYEEDKFKHFGPSLDSDWFKTVFEDDFQSRLWGWTLHKPTRYEKPIEFSFKGSTWMTRDVAPKDRWWP